jgi:hypothetical protein
VVAGWRGGQIGAVAAGLAVGVVVLRATPSVAGVVMALVPLSAGIAAATWPFRGRTAEEWTPDVLRHAVAGGGRRPPRAQPFHGVHLLRVEVGPEAATSPMSSPMSSPRPTRAGVLHDHTRRTFTAVLRATDPGFVLLSEDDKAGRLAAWASVLASLAREASAVHRLQWLERVLPADGAGARCHDTHASADHADHAEHAEHATHASYRALLEAEVPGARRHEVLVALSVHAGRAGRLVKAAGGGHLGACAVLLREVAALRRRLADSSVAVGAVLGPDEVFEVLRDAYTADPRDRPGLDASATDGQYRAPSSSRPWPWPMGFAAEWGRCRADATWHATYWMAERPRTDVPPDFLGPLLLMSDVRRTVSVVMAPQGPVSAARKVGQARTADIADAELRRRGGFLATARRRREEEVLSHREVELADGHGLYLFSGYVTVTAADPDALDVACGRVEQAAAQAGLELRRCYGDQAHAFTCTLPLGRGLS